MNRGRTAQAGAWCWHSWWFRWSFNTQFAVVGPAAILALLLHFRAARFAPAIKPRLVLYTWIFAVIVATIWNVRLFAYPWHFAMAAPAGYGDPAFVLVKGFLALPLCALAAYFVIVRPRVAPLLQIGFTVLLLAAVVPFWDQRSPAQHMMEQNRLPPEITRLINQQKGEVLWIDGSAEVWFFLGLPQWASRLQGTPTIFRPPLPPNGAAGRNSDGFEACGSKEFRAMECAQKRRSAAIVARGGAATLRAE